MSQFVSSYTETWIFNFFPYSTGKSIYFGKELVSCAVLSGGEEEVAMQWRKHVRLIEDDKFSKDHPQPSLSQS